MRKLIAYKEYFSDFYKAQDEKVREKIGYVLDLVRFERQVPKKFFKYLENTDEIYEVRVITTSKSIRILCFFDDGNLVVLANCFVKKTQKTPKKEIKLAEKLKKEYLQDKNNYYEKRN
jgi:phage-related protein